MPDYSTHAASVTQSGSGRRGASVKTLKRMLKKAGLKTSGRKAALTRRAKKAHLKVGGGDGDGMTAGRRRKMRGGEDCDENGMPEGCTPKVPGGRRRTGRKH